MPENYGFEWPSCFVTPSVSSTLECDRQALAIRSSVGSGIQLAGSTDRPVKGYQETPQGSEGKATKTIWNAFNWRDYDDDTQHLTILEHGAYFLLMKQYYKTGRPLPASSMLLQRICRANTDEECQAIATILTQFFNQRGEFYHQKRIDEELERVLGAVLARKKKGLIAAKARWEKPMPQASSKQCSEHTPSIDLAMPQNAILTLTPTLTNKPKTYIREKFTPPSIEEVANYCSTRGGKVDPHLWWDFYSGKGWMVGSNAMKDWRAAVRTWERNGRGANGNERQVSKARQRFINNLKAVGMEEEAASIAGGNWSDDGQGTDAGGVPPIRGVLEGKID